MCTVKRTCPIWITHRNDADLFYSDNNYRTSRAIIIVDVSGSTPTHTRVVIRADTTVSPYTILNVFDSERSMYVY